ncbi:MAG: hypothetical protein FD133_498 [Erysipelotrichaceae bacterium]|nr:MAG: hypothetical protein FD133_498 [Erysipelotrichaceae bacterium]
MKDFIDKLVAQNNSLLSILSKGLLVQIIMWCIMFMTVIIFIGDMKRGRCLFMFIC